MKADLIAEILDRGRDDWVDFAEVISIVRTQTGLPEPAATRMSVDLIAEMLNEHAIIVGDLQEQHEEVSFAPWDGQPPQIVKRIQSDVAALGHRPGLGEVCWLSTT